MDGSETGGSECAILRRTPSAPPEYAIMCFHGEGGDARQPDKVGAEAIYHVHPSPAHCILAGLRILGYNACRDFRMVEYRWSHPIHLPIPLEVTVHLTWHTY